MVINYISGICNNLIWSFGLIISLLAFSVSAQNPTLITDIAPFPYSSTPDNFVVLGSKLLFSANRYNESGANRELFVTDGTENGTKLLLDLNGNNNSSSPERLIAINGKVYFAVADNSMGALVYRPWVSDGTPDGTFALLPGATDFSSYILQSPMNIRANNMFVEYKGMVYFISTRNVAPYNRVIFKTDGTQQGTDVAIELPNSSNIYNLINGPFVYNDSLYFSGTIGGGIENMYKSDGTTQGSVMVKSNLIMSAVYGACVYDNKLYFTGNTSQEDQTDEPWLSDGKETGTFKLPAFEQGAPSGIAPTAYTRLNGKLIYLGYQKNNTTALFAIDSTIGSTVINKLATISNVSYSYTNEWLYESNQKVYFRGSDADHGDELWHSDGTVEGTALLKDMNPGSAAGNPHAFVEYCGETYFTAADPQSGRAQVLYKTDGTSEGIIKIPGLVSNPADVAGITAKVAFNNVLVFSGQYEVNTGEELYQYDANCNSVGIQKEITLGLQFYPNPVQDCLHFSSPIGTYSIRNMVGKLMDCRGSGEYINTGHLADGIYFITIGKDTYRFVKSKP